MKKVEIDGDMVLAIIKLVLAIVMLICMFFAIVDFVKGLKNAQSVESVDRIELASIDVTSNIEGRFYLGSGRINEKEYYAAYKILTDGGKKLYKMDASVTTIYENLEENEMAYAEEIRDGFGYLKEIKLYIPKNTIKQEYDFSIDY